MPRRHPNLMTNPVTVVRIALRTFKFPPWEWSLLRRMFSPPDNWGLYETGTDGLWKGLKFNTSSLWCSNCVISRSLRHMCNSFCRYLVMLLICITSAEQNFVEFSQENLQQLARSASMIFVWAAIMQYNVCDTDLECPWSRSRSTRTSFCVLVKQKNDVFVRSN